MTPDIARRWKLALEAKPNWGPEQDGPTGLVAFRDDKTYDLGPDPSGERFRTIADRMLTGRYYPVDAVKFYGDWEGRELQTGDRILQRAPLIPGLYAWSVAEIFVATRSEGHAEVGYVTTTGHHGKGWWKAELTRQADTLSLRVRSLAMPGSILYKIGIPVARYLQLRARRRAVEEFRKL